MLYPAGDFQINHARFDNHARIRQIHFQDAIHPREADHDSVFNRKRSTA